MLVMKGAIQWRTHGGGGGGIEGSRSPTLLKYCPRDLSKNDVKLMGGGGSVYCMLVSITIVIYFAIY